MKNTIENYFKGDYKPFFAKYLTGVKQIGNDEYRATCLFHDDTNPSLNFNSKTGMYHCHGCQAEGDIFSFFAKLHNLDTKADFPEILKGIANDFGIAREKQKSRIVKTYDYLNADGKVHSQTVRMDPKSFFQRRPDGNGGWITKDIWKDTKPILYNLPDVLKAPEVIIVEGEKDADTANLLGFIGTTCPMGAGSWRDEYSQTLKGKDVVLIPDNDDQGRKHMTKIAASLQNVAKSLKWVELPGLPIKGDVSDFIESFGDDPDGAGEKLAIMIENAEPYESPHKKTIKDAILELNDFKNVNLPIKRQILSPWLTEQSISLLTGWRGTGKTWFAMSLLDAITRGEPFGPWDLNTSVPCLYLEGEMAAQDVRERLEALNPDQDRQNPLFVYSDAYSNSLGLPRANMLEEQWRATMKEILTTKKIKLWVVDNIASLTGGIDENSKKDWDPINQWLLELRFAGISTILLHHTNKTGAQRGTSAREDNIDVSITLKRPFNYIAEDGAKFIVNFQKARVSTKDLSKIADTQFQLSQDEQGGLVWTWGNVRHEKRTEVLKLFDEGMTAKDVVDTLGVSKGYVSKIKTQAIKDGILSTHGKLSQSGFTQVYGGAE